ncbi:MAG TPA: glycosyltransferase family 39 protein, partial [Aggregatilineales bacterium]|nr:glycosyltransferase family 39 protein [Aggregatilineales bacterium]
MTTDLPPENQSARRFEDLTLLELIMRLVFNPGSTLDRLSQTLSPASTAYREPITVPSEPRRIAYGAPFPAVSLPALDWTALGPVLLMGGVLLFGLAGSILLFNQRLADVDSLNVPFGGYVLLGAGLLMAVVSAISLDLRPYPRLAADSVAGPGWRDLEAFLATHRLAIILTALALFFSAGAWILNTGPANIDPGQPQAVVFTGAGVFSWLMSIFCWVGVFTDFSTAIPRAIDGIVTASRDLITKPINIKPHWTLVTMIVILLIGGYFRFSNLSTYPPEMTSDHKEKALDSYAIYADGYRPVFLPNNGGREPFHFYFLALLEATSGHPMDFDLLKIGSGLWGMLEIVLAFWAGRSIFGEDNRDFGNLVGVLMAAMIAISYWGTMLSRLGLRIITMTLVTTILVVFLIRAMRHNRRLDYLLAGLTLGWGIYCYQSARLLPLLAIACIPIFLALRCRSWATLRKFIVNFAAMTIVAVAVTLPMAHYAQNFPGFFWSRATGRLVGYDAFTGK